MNESPSSEPAAVTAVKVVFRGIGQIIFQENAITGVLFVAGILLGAPLEAAGIVLGAAIGTATAHLMNFDKGDVVAGIYGFNAALVGIATFFFFQLGVGSILLMVVGCIAAAFLTMLMKKHVPFPTYTTPFILVTWAIYLLAPLVGAAMHEPGYPADPVEIPYVIEAVAHGVGQVMFQGTLAAGILFLIGMAVGDWRHAAWVLAGSVVGMAMATFHLTVGASALDPHQLVERSHFANVALGLYGYNATLTAVALFLWRRSLIPPLLGMVLTVPLTEFIPLLGIPALTAPFVLATWIILVLGRLDRQLFKEASPAAA